MLARDTLLSWKDYQLCSDNLHVFRGPKMRFIDSILYLEAIYAKSIIYTRFYLENSILNM